MAVTASTPIELVEAVYGRLPERVAARPRAPRAAAHLRREDPRQPPRRPATARSSSGAVSYADFDPDRVAMQDATAQMALLQFMTAGLPAGGGADHRALRPPHPGQGRRRHRPEGRRSTPTPRSTSSCAVGVGQVRHRLLEAGLGHHPPGRAREVRLPRRDDDRHRQPHAQRRRPRHGRHRRRRRRRRRRDDRLPVQRALARSSSACTSPASSSGWSAPKDVILKVAEILTVKGGTGAIVEYFGPGADSHLGHRQGHDLQHGRRDRRHHARCSPTTRDMAALPARPPGARRIADAADAVRRRPARRRRGAGRPRARTSTRSSRSTSTSSSRSSTARTPPTCARPVSRGRRRRPRPRAGRSRSRSALVGSCTNSSYEDITRAASIARQAVGQGPARPRRRCSSRPAPSRCAPRSSATACSPTSRPSAATVLANACGPCIGQWERDDLDDGEAQHDRQQLQPQLPEAQRRQRQHAGLRRRRPRRSIALALAGTLDFDPRTDTLTNDAGEEVRLDPPVGEELPGAGLRPRRDAASSAPPDRRHRRRGRGRPRRATGCSCSSRSPPWDGKDYDRAAGPAQGAGQVHHRPHLGGRPVAEVPRPPREHLAATSSSARSTPSPARPAQGKDPLDGETKPFPEIAKHYHEAGIGLGGHRRRELRRGLVPRARGDGAALPQRPRSILVRSFARIHETNLKKQGVLPLTFADPATYDQIGEDDRICVLGLADLAPDTPVRVHDHQARRHHGRLRGQPHLQPRADRVVQGRRRPQHHPPEDGEGVTRPGPCGR